MSNAGDGDDTATGQQLEVRTETEQLNPRRGGRFYFDLDPDRHDDGGGMIKIRLVKGANLAMERVDAVMHGWPQAT